MSSQTLPAQIRNRIYRYALVTEQPMKFHHAHFDLSGALMEKIAASDGLRSGMMRCVMQPPLTRTCRIIREESLPVFYGANTFEAILESGWQVLDSYEREPRGGRVLQWLKAIGPKIRALILHFRARAVSTEDLTKTVRSFRKAGVDLGVQQIFKKAKGRLYSTTAKIAFELGAKRNNAKIERKKRKKGKK